jgi:hypothetical protein
MEERVRELEWWNKRMRWAITFILVLGVSWVFYNKTSDILVGKQVTTAGIVVMDQLGPQQKPQVQLLPATTDTLLTFIGSNNRALLSIGIQKDPKQGEIPMIIFETKAGRQILAPNEEGKVTWTEVPMHQSND